MKKINENTKVTLTVRQLKRLIKEGFEDKDFSNDEAKEEQYVKSKLIEITDNLNSLINDTLYGSKAFRNYLKNAIGFIDVARWNYNIKD